MSSITLVDFRFLFFFFSFFLFLPSLESIFDFVFRFDVSPGASIVEAAVRAMGHSAALR